MTFIILLSHLTITLTQDKLFTTTRSHVKKRKMNCEKVKGQENSLFLFSRGDHLHPHN